MREKLLRMLSVGIFALVLPALIAGCNTMRGMGQDTQDAGEAIEEQADDEDDY